MISPATIPDAHAYISLSQDGMRVFQPWLVDPDISTLMSDITTAGRTTLVNWDRLWTLKCAAMQTRSLPGEIWEAGVYQGGSALLLKRLSKPDSSSHTRQPHLRLFDTFSGLPYAHPGIDLHHEGEFADTSLNEVRRFVGTDDFIDYRDGLVPDTFVGLEQSKIRLVHLDLDLYQGTQDALVFIYPRVSAGGVIVIDDYGFITCPGVRRAVDAFFEDKPEAPLILPTGQAVVHRLPAIV